MALRLKTLAIGFQGAPAQFPIRDFSRATKYVVFGEIEQNILLEPGHYEVRSDKGFSYKVGSTAKLAGFTSVPHDANVWLGISVDEECYLNAKLDEEGSLWVIPMETYL